MKGKKVSRFLTLMVALLGYLITVPALFAEEPVKKEPPAQVLFTNVNIFDGKSEEVGEGHERARGEEPYQGNLEWNNQDR